MTQRILDFTGINLKSAEFKLYTPGLRIFTQHLKDIRTEFSVFDDQSKGTVVNQVCPFFKWKNY